MPDYPNPKLYQGYLSDPPTSVTPCEFDYAELDVVTNFSFLRGASHADELVYTAALHGYRAIAVTDVNTLAGAVRMHQAAKQCGLKLLIGTRLTFVDGSPDLLVWATDRAAYGRMCRLLTTGKRRAEKGECKLTLADFLEHNEGLLAAIASDPEERRRDEETERRSEGENAASTSSLRLSVSSSLRPYETLRDALGDRLSLAVSRLYSVDDESHVLRLLDLSRNFDIPLLATNHVHYHDAGRRAIQDVLVCVRHGCTIQEAGYKLFPNGERYLKTPAQMHRLFADCPQAIRRGMEIAERCSFNLGDLKYEYPDEIVPPGQTAIQYLKHLCDIGAAEHYPGGVPEKVRGLIAHELELIERLKFEAYFLTVYDLVKFARSRGILCQGRGSAANSAVCYCLGVTSVDPAKIDLLFERFISAARGEPPDIDIDFEHERREEVLQYLYNKYGRDRAGMTAEVITYRGRSAVRDVGKALGLGLDLVDSMAKRLDWWHRGVMNEAQLRETGLDPRDETVRRVVELTGELLGFPRHLGQHVGGMVMTRGPLCEMVPIENASMEDRTVIEWDKNDIDDVGILKVDALALGMLTCISKAFRMVEEVWENQALRHKGTKALREGRNIDGRLEQSWEDQDVSRLDCVATGDGFGAGGISDDPPDAGRGAIRAGRPDVARGLLSSIEHRGRLRTAEHERLSKISTGVARLARRVVDAIRVGNDTEDHSPHSAGVGPAGRGGSHFAIPDHEPRTQASREEGQTKVVLTTQTGQAFPLSASVPQCLSAFPPPRLQLHTIPSEDPAVYDMICDADTVGVFQIESRAQMSMLPRLRPHKFYDLVIEVAIVRPGPIQGDMVHPYLKRRNGEEPVSYPSQELHDVLSRTLGVPLFQEQAMKVVMVAAGFNADQADLLRRAMAAWRRGGLIEKFYPKVIDGMLANGYTREFAEQTFNQIRGFGEYGFPESHAASFALLVYVSSWLKRHHPAAFTCALLNSQPMGFYMPAQLVRDAKEHGVEVREVDVNESGWDCLLERETERRRDEETKWVDATSSTSSLRHFVSPSPPEKSTWGEHGPALRLGFREIKGLREDFANRVVAARERHGRFASVAQFHQLTALPVHALRRLAETDAFSSLGLSRRQALWEVMALKDDAAPLFDAPADEPVTQLPTMPIGQEVMTDYATTGMSLKKHPLALLRPTLSQMKILPASVMNQQPHGRWVKVAGLVLIRQRPGTASGIVFETLEDETGIVNLIVRPDVYERYKSAARHATLAQADGYVERQGQVVHVMVKRMFDLTHLIRGLDVRSRDFH